MKHALSLFILLNLLACLTLSGCFIGEAVRDFYSTEYVLYSDAKRRERLLERRLLLRERSESRDGFVVNGVIASGGDGGALPDQSIESIQAAIARGVEWVALEVVANERYEPVIVSEVDGSRNELPLAEVLHLMLAQNTLHSPARDLSASMITDTLAIESQTKYTRLMLCVEDSVLQLSAEIVRLMECQKWIVFSSWSDLGGDPRIASEFTISKRWSLESAPELHHLKLRREFGIDYIEVPFQYINAALVKNCREAGITLIATAITEEHEATLALDMGITHLCSEDVEMLDQLLHKRSIPEKLPASSDDGEVEFLVD